MRNRHLVTLFNDDNEGHVRSLEAAINNLPGIDRLRYQPKFWNKRVEGEVAEHFKTIALVPTLLFADPWGYKGLSLDLIKCVLRNWGTDCIFFFNFNRVNMHLGQPIMDRNMNDLFGEQRADELRRQLDLLDNPPEREKAVVHAIADELKSFGVVYAPYFTFTNDDGNKTSHHIILASKAHLADRMMRRITPSGVPPPRVVSPLSASTPSRSDEPMAPSKPPSSTHSEIPTPSTTWARNCSSNSPTAAATWWRSWPSTRVATRGRVSPTPTSRPP